MTDQYANWRERLANAALPRAERKKIPTYESVVDPGFYRKRITEKTPGGATKTVGYEPVAFWIDKGQDGERELFGLIGNRQLNAGQCEAEWTWVCDKPISEEVYRAVAERKEPWPDQHAPRLVVPEGAITPEMMEEFRKPGAVVQYSGDDKPLIVAPDPAPDPSAEIIAEINALKGGVAQYKNIESDEQAAKAQDLRAQLTAAAGRLDKHRESLVRPHLDAQQTINRRFNPVITATKGEADKIKRAQVAWETQKREAAREAARRAEEERARIEAENAAAARAAEEAGRPPPEMKPAVEAISNAPPPSDQIKGMTGRAASVREAFEAVITDQDALYGAVRTNPLVIEVLRKVAQARVDAGISTAGVERREIVKIR